ncbi:MAG: SpoIIE family protein phosphatase [Desulfobacterales bacterium]
MKILIAEDDLTSRMMLTTVLKKLGHDVVETASGSEAWDVVQKPDAPRLAILDWMMPEMDGIEVCRRIRAMNTDTPTYVIMLTSRTEKEDLVAGLEAGADDYLAKPFDPAELSARVEVGHRMVEMQGQLAGKIGELESLHHELQRQYDIAGEVFSKIMESNERRCGNVNYLLSAMETASGDMALSVPKPTGGMYAFLGDFTGHGLSAAIGAVPVANIFFEMTDRNYSICDIAAAINAKLKETLPIGMYLAACFLELEFSSGTLTVWNGGIPDVLVVGRKGGIKNRIPSSHVPLGVIGNDQLDLSVALSEIEQDDRIYVYSDGVIETSNSDGEMFDQQRLEEHFLKGPLPESALETINDSLETFRAGTSQDDDTTMMEIICNAETAGNLGDGDATKNRKGARGWNLSMQLEADALRNTDVVSFLVKIIEEDRELCAHKEDVFLIVTELVLNAMDYGIFRLDPALKKSLDGYEDYMEARLKGFESIGEGWLRVELEYAPLTEGGKLVVRVEDSGPGFNYQKTFLALSDNLTFSGRGIPLVRSLCPEFTYHGRGNRVEAVYEWTAEPS